MQTNYGGLFLMIHYLQNHKPEQKIAALALEEKGIGVLESFLY